MHTHYIPESLADLIYSLTHLNEALTERYLAAPPLLRFLDPQTPTPS
jgi:hypothetical protein